MMMEMLTHKSNTHLLLITLSSLSFFLCICRAVSPPGSVQLSQQLLLSSLDAASASSQPFLTSPSGTYEARLVRSRTDSGDSSCFILVQAGKLGSGSNIIGCGPVSGSHVCSLVFSTAGLGILDGMKPTWSTSIPSGDHAKGLVLLDSGDMEIISDGSGRVAWKASESRIVADHNCGSGFSLFGISPSDDEQQQDSVMGDFEQQQEGLGNYPKQPQQGRNSGFDQQPYDQKRHSDDDDSFENGVSGRGLEIIGVVVIVTLMYLIAFVP